MPFLRSVAQKVSFILLLPAATIGTNPRDIASLSQIFPEIIELLAYFFQLIERLSLDFRIV